MNEKQKIAALAVALAPIWIALVRAGWVLGTALGETAIGWAHLDYFRL